MLLQQIKLKNIRSYIEETINFVPGSTLLSGDIGCGKSTILLAIEFALFGISRPDLLGEALLKKGASFGSVELSFNINGEDIIIQRALKKAGFIKNIRGKNGGYSLSMPASMITLKDIVQTVEGSLAPVECVDKPEKCTRSYYCPTRDVWSELKVTIENTLEAKTLQNLIDSHNQKLQPQFNYSI